MYLFSHILATKPGDMLRSYRMPCMSQLKKTNRWLERMNLRQVSSLKSVRLYLVFKRNQWNFSEKHSIACIQKSRSDSGMDVGQLKSKKAAQGMWLSDRITNLLYMLKEWKENVKADFKNVCVYVCLCVCVVTLFFQLFYKLENCQNSLKKYLHNTYKAIRSHQWRL